MPGPYSKEELASRGKVAEKRVREFLEARKEKDRGFDFQRQYDARTARGRFPAQTGDYLLFRNFTRTRREGTEDEAHLTSIHHAVLEAKQLDHDYRLPAKNFPHEQIARLKRRQWAGATIIIAIFHTTTQKWRVPHFNLFANNLDVPSWDLRGEETFDTPAAALNQFWYLFQD